MNEFSIAIGIQLIDNFSRDLFRLKEQTQQFHEQLEKTTKSVKSFSEILHRAFDPKRIWEASEKFESFSAKVAQATALPIAGFTKMLRDFSEMENARVEMEVAFMTKTGLPEELDKINKQVEELGVELPGSAMDFYRVATALKSTGMTAKDIAEGGLKAASYAWVLFKREVSPEQAAEYMQKFANAFRIPSSEFMAFIDQLQRVKFASGLSLTEIAYSTKYFSAELNQLGVTGTNAFKLMGAWLGTLKQFGLEGETAGTSIRSVLQNIINLEQNLSKLKKTGIDLQLDPKKYFDEKGAFRLESFLINLRDKLSQIQDPLQRMTAVKTLFDSEGMRAIAPLLAKSKEEALSYLETIKENIPAEEFEKLKKQIQEGGFSGLEDMAKKMQQQAALQDRINRTLSTFQNIWESFQGTLAGFGAIIGEFVAPPLKKLLDFLNDFFGKIGDFLREHKTLSTILTWSVGGFVGLLAVLGATGIVIGSFMKLASFAFSPFLWLMRTKLIQNFTMALWQNLTALIRWAVTGQASTGWLKVLDFFLLKTKLRLLEVVGAIRLKIVALWQWALAMTRNVWAGMLAGLKALATGFRTAMLAVRSFTLSLLTNPIFLAITAIAVGAFLIIKYWKPISEFFKSLWRGIVSIFTSAWNWLKSSWQKVLQVFLWTNPLTAPIMALNKTVYGINLFDAGKKLIESLWKGIQSVAMKPVEAVKGIVAKIRNFLPFSPAKEGPLRDLHRIKLIETIAQGINPVPLVEKMKQVLEPVKASIQPLIQPVRQVLEPVKSHTGINIVVNLGGINISGQATEKEARQIAINLEREIRTVLEKLSNERFRRQY